MNLFSTDVFLESVAATYYPRRRFSLEDFQLEGRRYRLLALDGRSPVTEVPCMDFVEPLPGGGSRGRPPAWLSPHRGPPHGGGRGVEGEVEDCYRRGHQEFDFLIGGEGYKWDYATHTRVVGPVGEVPLREVARRTLERHLGGALRRLPFLWTHVERLRNHLR